ncbi:MAG: DUF3343 domain-containing protein [Bacillota bacterium]|nr:DUF3343 domain-containing protein [Bacillota bacterium]
MKKKGVKIMGKQLLMLTSVTFAMKGQEILKKKGIQSEIIRTPKRSKTEGCSFSLSVPIGLIDEAQVILKNAGIPVQGRRDSEA